MPGFKGVRYSKFRHVYGQPAKKNECYDSLKISRNAHDNNFCAINPKFVAVITESSGGGSFAVIPIETTGRVDPNLPKVCGHAGSVLDIKWNPFNDCIIASCAEDGTIMVWEIPENGLETENLSEPLVTLRGHVRRCGVIEWHPTAEHILASAGFDGKVFIWNIEKGRPAFEIKCHPEAVTSLAFNWDGSLLATTCKDKRIRIIDPRTTEVLQEGEGHQGTKSSKISFVADTGKLVTTGLTRGSERQIGVWDQNNLSSPLTIIGLDFGTGVLFPFVDHDHHVVYVAGKGDSNIRYFEILDEAPYLYYLNMFMAPGPQRGFGSMPKRGLELCKCEIMRFYKLYASKPICEPISMIVPRKYEAFQEDLYPDTPGAKAAVSAQEWIAGVDKSPILMSLGGVPRKQRSEPVPRPTPQSTRETERTRSRPESILKHSHSEDVSRPGTSHEAAAIGEEKKDKPKMTTSVSLDRNSNERVASRNAVKEEYTIKRSEDFSTESVPNTDSLSPVTKKKEVTFEKESDSDSSKNISKNPFFGLEGGLSVAERRARWTNNADTPAATRFVRADPWRSSERTFKEYQKEKGSSKSQQKSASANSSPTKTKIERTLSSEGKETFRIDMNEQDSSVLPSRRPVSIHEDTFNRAKLIDDYASPPDDMRKKRSLSEERKVNGVESRRMDAGGHGNLVTSKQMGTDQLRKAYLRQQEDIKQMKSQLLLKDQRIRQLEREIELLTNNES